MKTPNTVTQYSYLNTNSSKGNGEHREIVVADILYIFNWYNTYGNPSYVFHMENGDTHYLVDAYGAMNNIEHLNCRTVSRRKDLF